MNEEINKKVHQAHCCAIHGCKYGEEDCPVVTKEVDQFYICESCPTDGINDIETLNKAKKLSDLRLTQSEIDGISLSLTLDGEEEIFNEEEKERIKLKLDLLKKCYDYFSDYQFP